MTQDPRPDPLVAPLREDTVSGAALVARTAADVMRRAAIRIQAGSLEEFRWGLGQVALQVLDAQPSMAPLVTLLQDVLSALEGADTLEHARHAAASAAEDFQAGLDERSAAVARHAADVLPTKGMIATISSSSTVRATLLAARPERVLCFESRPMDEGRSLAEALAKEGIPVTYAVDAAAYSLVPGCSAVLLGADSIGDRGVVNKIGSAMLVLAATAAAVPVHVLCDGTKVLPVGFPQVVEDDRPGREVWGAPEGVTVWNRYFEVIPLELVTRVVTEEGTLTPGKLEAARAGIPFPDFLKRWAEGR
jgi:translation initiation factor eIF-2B subunit delta